jgi:hypothetical protein
LSFDGENLSFAEIFEHLHEGVVEENRVLQELVRVSLRVENDKRKLYGLEEFVPEDECL